MEHHTPFHDADILEADDTPYNALVAHERASNHNLLEPTQPLLQPHPRPRSEPSDRQLLISNVRKLSSAHFPQSSASLFHIPRSRLNDCTTLCDEYLDETLISGSWSCETCADIFIPEDASEKPKPKTRPQYVLKDKAKTGQSSLFASDIKPTRPIQFLDQYTKVRQADVSPFTSNSVQMFLKEPGPWSSYNLRKLGTMCALCGSTFSGSTHQTNARRHVHKSHASLQHSFFESFGTHQPIALLENDKSDLKRSECALDFVSPANKSSTSKYPPGSMIDAKPCDLAGTSSWMCHESFPNLKQINNPRVRAVQLTSDRQPITQERLLYLLNRLDPSLYPRQVNNFFNGLDIVVANLQQRFPNDALVSGIRKSLSRLEHHYFVAYGHASCEVGQNTCAPTVTENSSRVLGAAPSPTENSVNGCSNLDPNRSTANIPTSSQDQRPVAIRDVRKVQKSKGRLLACPIKKHCETHSQLPLCTFKGAAFMSEVATHLKSRDHRQFLPILLLCKICRAYTISAEEYQNLHMDGLCQPTSQPRGVRVAEHWLDLYRKIYPQSNRIPSPYIDEASWTNARSVDCVNPALNNNSIVDFSSQSFLDQGSIAQYNHAAHDLSSQPYAQDMTERDADIVAMELFAQIRSGSTEGDFGINELMNQVRRMRPEDVESLADRFLAGANALYQRIQGHSNPSQAQEFGSMADSNSLILASGIDLLATPSWSQQDAIVAPLDGVWTGGPSIPIATEVSPPTDIQTVQLQMPSQYLGHDSLHGYWGDHFIIPQAFDLVPNFPFTIDDTLSMSDGLRSSIHA